MDPVALIGVAGSLTRVALAKYLHDAAQDFASGPEVAAEGRAVAAAAEARMQRAQTLTSLGAREVFPAGSAILTDDQGELHPRPAVIAVTKDDLVLLDADPDVDDDVLGRIPRSEITDVRLLDQSGARPRPTTDVEELDAPEARYVVWLDGDEGRGHPFVFPSYTVAAEAERDFRRQLSN